MSLTPEQLEQRLSYICGSDCSTIMGLNPWGNKVDLWKQKRRMTQAQDISGKPAVRAGNYLEPVVTQWFEDDTGKDVETDTNLIIHKTIPYMAANIDGRVVDDRAVFEAKTAYKDTGWGDIGENIIPDHYLCQVAHYMAVEDAHRAFVAVLIRGSDFRWYTIERDLRLEETILQKEYEFWELVKTGTPPNPSTSGEIISLYGSKTSGAEIEATLDVERAVFQLREVKEAIKKSTDRQKSLEETVKVYMGQYPTLKAKDGKMLASWKETKPSSRFNSAKFKSEQEELYSQYLTDAASQRRFLIK